NGNEDGGNNAGSAYVIFGKEAGYGTINLANLTAADGFIIQGDAAGDELGATVSAAGDIDGDGYDDLIVGARYGDDGGSGAGEAYIIYGQADIGQDVVQGTAADDALVGTANVDILIGGRGADSFADIGTGDVVRGGEGDDVITLTATDFDDINGGTGMDTLALAGTGMDLDLTTFLPGDLKSIEAIDLTGTGDNTLTITEQTLFDVSGWRMDGEAWMIVKGDAGDSVVGAEGFTFGGTYDYEGVTYNLYERGRANVLVEQDVTFTNAATGKAAVIDTSILREHYGFIVQGDAADDNLGYLSMQSMGDINGDGYDDMVVGANANDDGGTNTGAAYVIFGGASGFGALDATGRRVIDLSTPLTATEGFAILGAADS
ncbi:hypothetical protein GRI39_14375, partial [Altererythrobacter indicus]